MNTRINILSPHFAIAFLGYTFLSLIAGCDLSGQSLQDSIISSPPKSELPDLTKPTTNAGPLSDKPMSTTGSGLPERKIDLLECKAVAESVSRYKLSLTYEFLAGPPNPNSQYLVSVTFPGCEFAEMKIVEGNSLSSAGTIEWTYNLPETAVATESKASTVKFIFSEQYEHDRNQRSFLQIGGAAITTLDKSALGS